MFVTLSLYSCDYYKDESAGCLMLYLFKFITNQGDKTIEPCDLIRTKTKYTVSFNDLLTSLRFLLISNNDLFVLSWVSSISTEYLRLDCIATPRYFSD